MKFGVTESKITDMHLTTWKTKLIKKIIIGIGAADDKLYYYKLTAIAVDFSKEMRQCKENSTGWERLPKNNTQIKERIVERLLAMRELNVRGDYTLNQSVIIHTFHSIWGGNNIDGAPHHNDRLRLFGILMSKPDFREHIERLTEGVNSRAALDNPSLSLKQIFVEAALAFNNEDIIVDMPDESMDLEHVGLLNPNDQSRIGSQRDRK